MDPATTDPATDLVPETAADRATDPATDPATDLVPETAAHRATDPATDRATDLVPDRATDLVPDRATDLVPETATDPAAGRATAPPAGVRRDEVRTVPWRQGWWLNRPPHVAINHGRLLVRAAQGSDAWRTTSYGFNRDSAHALLSDLPDGWAVQVSFLADFDRQFDQAGLLVRIDDRHWAKAGVEFADGSLQASAVITDQVSDWSVAWAPDWVGGEVTVRVSRSGDALTFRIRSGDEPWRLLRLAPIAPDAVAYTGPYCAAPERDGLTVTFTRWAAGPADERLHGD